MKPTDVLRNLPSVNDLLNSPALKDVAERANRSVVVGRVRRFLDDMRQDIKQAADFHVPDAQELAEHIARWMVAADAPHLRPVINATGVLLHTGLGRAPLPEAAIDEIRKVSGGYCNLEFDLVEGRRSQRLRAVEHDLCELTGAEAALVVNNNAASLVLTLAALALDKEVIVSRGQLIEIGGSFRLPEIMEASGAKMREVGTTNKTRIDDFRQAASEETAALLRVHTSNYVVVGFTEQPALRELVALGREKNLPVIDDIGSGAMFDYGKYGLTDEPLISDSLQAGSDVVLCSGDKLLGGPQCGLILGHREHLDVIARHPLMRAMRVGKLTLAALAGVLRLYRENASAEHLIPVLSLLSTSLENLQNRAERLAPQLAAAEGVAAAEVIEDRACLGGGSLPSQSIPTYCVALTPDGQSVDHLARVLRSATPAIVGRVQNERLLLDMRTIFPREDRLIVQAVAQLSTDAENAHENDPQE